MKINELIPFVKLYAEIKRETAREGLFICAMSNIDFTVNEYREQPCLHILPKSFDDNFGKENYTIERYGIRDGVAYIKKIEVDGVIVYSLAANGELTLKDRTMLGLPEEEF